MEKTSSFILKYPENSGFDKTDIIFYSGTPELEKIYFDCEKTYPNRLFVTDTNIASLDCMKTFLSRVEANDAQGDRLLVLGAGEKYKTIESVLEIVKKALDANFNRNCVFVGIGGGVICDMTAFAASMFKRGVDVEFVKRMLEDQTFRQNEQLKNAKKEDLAKLGVKALICGTLASYLSATIAGIIC